MKIDAGTNYLYASQRSQGATTDRPAITSFSAALSAAQANDTRQASDTRQADFTSMTRQEMRDWVNTQIRSGEMSLDDSRPFMAMTMKVQVGVGFGGDVAAGTDATRYDFTQKVRDGIEGALARNDQTTYKMLESAMAIMLRQQGQTIGVDSLA